MSEHRQKVLANSVHGKIFVFHIRRSGHKSLVGGLHRKRFDMEPSDKRRPSPSRLFAHSVLLIGSSEKMEESSSSSPIDSKNTSGAALIANNSKSIPPPRGNGGGGGSGTSTDIPTSSSIANLALNNSSNHGTASNHHPNVKQNQQQQQHHHQHNHDRSAVVWSLFGKTVGPCVGDFSTTYFRASGRLYASTHAILFYSNLFGFERRLCLRLSDIDMIEAYRSTSIRISMVDCEDHIFRKFTNRERVLQILTDLYDQETMGTTRLIPILSDMVEVQEDGRDGRGSSSRRSPSRSVTPEKHKDLNKHVDDDDDDGGGGDSESMILGDNPMLDRPRISSESSIQFDDLEDRTRKGIIAAVARRRTQSMPSLEDFEGTSGDAVPSREGTTTTTTTITIPPITHDNNVNRILVDASPSSSLNKRGNRRVFRRTISSLTIGRSTTLTGTTSTTPGTDNIPEESAVESDDRATTIQPQKPQQQSGLSVSQVSSPPVPADFDMQAAWTQANVPYDEMALERTIIPCSLEVFMDLFFSNEASFPISKYQTDVILDREVSYTKWNRSRQIFPPLFYRDVGFIHPLSNPLGPSEAKTSREQRFQRFGKLGAILLNTTTIHGVPGADCFKIEDRWVVESMTDTTTTSSSSKVVFTVSFQVNFSKRTMMKPLIQKNIKIETKKWFQGYVEFIQRSLHEDCDRKEDSPTSLVVNPPTTDNGGYTGKDLNKSDTEGSKRGFLWFATDRAKTTSTSTSMVSLLLFLILLILMVAVSILSIQLFNLHHSILLLQDQVTILRSETAELRNLLSLRGKME